MSVNLKIYSKKIKNINIENFEDDMLFYCFYGLLIKNGKKHSTEILLKDIFFFLKKKYPKEEPLNLILKALLQVKPVISLRVKKVAGINYQLPSPISNERACKLAVNWFFSALKNRSEKNMFNKIMGEILDLLKGKGVSKQKREALEKVALDNRPFMFFLKR